MQTHRWLIEYDVSASVPYFTETAATYGVRIVGVYQDALAFVAEGEEKAMMDWVASLAIRGVRSNTFPEEEVLGEKDVHRRQLMAYWNEYMLSSGSAPRRHDGLAWDHPGFLPPDRPEDPAGK